MDKFFKTLFIAAIGIFALLASWQSLDPARPQVTVVDLPRAVRTPLDPIIKGSETDLTDQPMRDNQDLYRDDVAGSLVTLYVTVRTGNASENTDSTWGQINDTSGWFSPGAGAFPSQRAEAIVQFGDEAGPLPGEVGYGAVVPNATIQLRGSSNAMVPQRSYHIELNQGAGKWRGQSTLALNKHVSDPARVRNKLNFDLLQGLPDLVSLRTQFIHLYVKDQTLNTRETTFVDYGLYTQVEVPDKRYLKNHLLDSNGQLYKAIDFRFDRSPDIIRLVDDPQFDEQAFASVLEIKGSRDNARLIQMLDELNNPNLPIETTFEKYFDPDNYFTWMAYNILVGHVDTANQNYYLYSPRNSSRFYFIPWDYDNSFSRLERAACCEADLFYSYQYGVANYWDNRLANRVLRIPAYRRLLDEKIREVMNDLTPERIGLLLEEYRPVIEHTALQMPDLQYLPTTAEGLEQDFETIPAEVQNNYELYLKSLRAPLPFRLGRPVAEAGVLSFYWEASYDFDGDPLIYHFRIARDPEFREIVVSEIIPGSTRISVEPLAAGEYFWSVTATDTAGEIQLPFDHLYDSNGNLRSGLKRFSILPDGLPEENAIAD